MNTSPTRPPEKLPDPWLFDSESLLRELDRCRELVLEIPITNPNATHFGINVAVTAIWNLRENLRYHKLFRQINRWLPFTISVISLAFSGIALRDQTQQSKTRVWQDFRREWDRDLKTKRIAFAEAFQKGDINKEYGHVMTFFENPRFPLSTVDEWTTTSLKKRFRMISSPTSMRANH